MVRNFNLRTENGEHLQYHPLFLCSERNFFSTRCITGHNFGKNSFTEVSKNLIRYSSENNYVGNSSMMSNAAKHFNILATSLSVLHNYFRFKQNYFQIYI